MNKPYCHICHKYIKLYSHLTEKESCKEHREIFHKICIEVKVNWDLYLNAIFATNKQILIGIIVQYEYV